MKEYAIEIKQWVYDKVKEIWDEIFRFTFNKESELIFYKEILRTIYSLRILPYRFPSYNSKYRVFIVSEKYVLFYRIKNRKVIVVYLFYSKENYDNYIST